METNFSVVVPALSLKCCAHAFITLTDASIVGSNTTTTRGSYFIISSFVRLFEPLSGIALDDFLAYSFFLGLKRKDEHRFDVLGPDRSESQETGALTLIKSTFR